MNSSEHLEYWKTLLPPGVEVCAGPVLANPPEITPLEQKTAGAMEADRLLEFRTGRAYAKQALSRLGLRDIELPVGPERAPIWPIGATGSIAHATAPGQSYVVAAVTKACLHGGIGIDVEFFNRAPTPRSWAQFLTYVELHYVRGLPIASRPSAALAIWCAKEAIIKALGQAADPLNIEVQYGGTLAGNGTEWRGRTARTTTELRVRTMVHANLVFAAAV